MDATRPTSTLESPVSCLKTGQLHRQHRVMFNHQGTTPMTSPNPAKPEKLIRLPDVEMLTGLKKSSVYALMKSGTFPYCVRLSTRAVAWKESEIQTWIGNRTAAGGRHD